MMTTYKFSAPPFAPESNASYGHQAKPSTACVYPDAAGFAPVTEDHPLAPESGYALAKTLCEKMASEVNRWNPGRGSWVYAFSNIFEEKDYDRSLILGRPGPAKMEPVELGR